MTSPKDPPEKYPFPTSAEAPFALLIHDMQNDWLGRGNLPAEMHEETAKEYIANHVALLQAARTNGISVIATGHYLRSDYYDAAPRDYRSSRCDLLRGTGAEIIDELQLRDDEFLVRKSGGMSAFTGTILDKLLRRLGIRTIIFAGGATHIGVDSTVRDASDRDYYCVVVSDACRSNSEEKHRASLLTLEGWFAEILSTETAIRLMTED